MSRVSYENIFKIPSHLKDMAGSMGWGLEFLSNQM